MQRAGVFEENIENRMSGLVPSGGYFFPFAHGHAAALFAPAHLVSCFLKFPHADGFQSFSSGEESGFIEDVGQFRTGVAWCATCENGEVHALGNFHFFSVDFKDFFTSLHVWKRNGDLAIKAAWTQEGRVEDIRAVCGCDDDDAFLSVEAVHLDEELVEGLLPFVVSAAHAVSAVATHGVNFINEHEAGSRFFPLFKHITNAGSSHADEHFHEV